MRKIQHFRHGAPRRSELQPLFDDLNNTRSALECAYARFDASTEPELVEACIYEINAAQARYNYLLRRVKEAGGEAAPLSGWETGLWA